MKEPKKFIGEAMSRIDGILKVTGTATYTTDFPVNNVVTGKAADFDISAAAVGALLNAADKRVRNLVPEK